jgi:hypothetical protein
MWAAGLGRSADLMIVFSRGDRGWGDGSGGIKEYRSIAMTLAIRKELR